MKFKESQGKYFVISSTLSESNTPAISDDGENLCAFELIERNDITGIEMHPNGVIICNEFIES